MSTPASDSPVPETLPMPAPRGRHLQCLLAIALLVALDLWSKAAAFDFLEHANLVRDETGHDRYPVLGNWLGLMRNLNYGAAFGQLKGISTALVGLRAVLIVGLAVLVVRVPRGQRLYLVALVLILAGAIGNLYDNLFHRPIDHETGRTFGPVRDFIDVYFSAWRWHFPTFNVADSCISVGAVLLLLSGVLGGGAAPEGHATSDSEESEPEEAPA